MWKKNRKGQSLLEYALLSAVVIAVIIAIQLYVKRSVEGKFKASADQIGEQFTTNENYVVETTRQTARKEQTLADLTAAADGEAWSKSEIQTADQTAWAKDLEGMYTRKAGVYKGVELNATDYVTATAGSGQVGTHGTFDSGKISEKKLFDDD